MAGTIREQRPVPQGVVQPVLVHVLSCEHLLDPPRGLWPVEGTMVVGREPGVDMPVSDGRVSGRHLAVAREGGATVATDLGSSNGTVINGQGVTTPVTLVDRDVIQVGRTFFMYRELPGTIPSQGWDWADERTQCYEVGVLGEKLDRAAVSREPIMLLGETGVGKELAARRIHDLSRRAGPLVAIDCGAIPLGLAESILFGHERGAFTGAAVAHQGELVRGHRGTVFLDELGNLPVDVQVKLLRAVETKVVRAVGGTEGVELDVRWVSATSPTLVQQLRSDLHYRLAGVVLRLLPLRARREDLGILLASLLAGAGAQAATLTPSAAWKLFTDPLPGNVRQLRHLVRSAVALATGAAVTLDDDALGAAEPSGPEGSSPPPHTRPAAGPPAAVRPRASAPDRPALEQALTEARGNVAAAARLLGTTSRQLYRWLDKEGLDPEHYRGQDGT